MGIRMSKNDFSSLRISLVLNPPNMKLSYIFLTLAATLVAFTNPPSALAANPEQVSILESTGKCPGCDLSGATLIGIDLANAQLQNANLNGANFAGANLAGANLTGVSAVGANFLGADLQRANLEKGSFVYANLAKAKLNNATLKVTDLQGANLAEADLTGARVTKTDFVGANLYKMKASKTLKDQANGNFFKDDRAGIRVTINSGGTTTERIVGDGTFESGGGRVIRRKYRVPAWVGASATSTAGSSRYHNPQDPDLILDLW
jgi:uncharacterized protein YjbI with pentapeptide repeats